MPQLANQFSLLRTRRFLPFFATQFFGAFNDNIYKNVLIIMLAFHSQEYFGVDSNILINIAAGIFILPFFLFASAAGDYTDGHDKAAIMRAVKVFELLIMLLASVALAFNAFTVLLLLLFLMGVHSACFAPAKYSIIPQHLQRDELVGGNGMISMGTTLAILIGTMVGGVLADVHIPALTGAVLVAVAFAGWVASTNIPPAPPPLRGRNKIDWVPMRRAWITMRELSPQSEVFWGIMGISWFWFVGAAYLTQLPNLTRVYLHGTPLLATLIITLFSLGIALGSLLCERLSARRVEPGLVLLGLAGLAVFGIDIYFALPMPSAAQQQVTPWAFMADAAHYRLMFDLLMIGLCGGIYIVPLNALIQYRVAPERRAQAMAANSVLNALFMVVSAIAGAVLLGMLSVTIPELFLLVALGNIIMAGFLILRAPEFLVRYVGWLLNHSLYRISFIGAENIPNTGPALLICNHVSYIDTLIIAAACERPVRFVIYKPIYDAPLMHFIYKSGKAIPIASQSHDPAVFDRGMMAICTALQEGALVCLFPEGKMTFDGEMNIFRRGGIDRILQQTPVPVVPMALRGLWGSYFSRFGGRAFTRLPQRLFVPVELIIGHAIIPEALTVESLYESVRELRGEKL